MLSWWLKLYEIRATSCNRVVRNLSRRRPRRFVVLTYRRDAPCAWCRKECMPLLGEEFLNIPAKLLMCL